MPPQTPRGSSCNSGSTLGCDIRCVCPLHIRCLGYFVSPLWLDLFLVLLACSVLPALNFFTPNEIARHNHPGDCWLSWLGKVYDVTTLIRDNRDDAEAIQPLLDHAGKDISHWFNAKTGMLRTCLDESSGLLVPFLPMGKLLHASPRDPRSDFNNSFLTPWWLDTQYCIGILTKKPRFVRIVNMLTQDEHVLEVCCEETLEQIRTRSLEHNAHAHSYTWKYLGHVLDMGKTLPENGIPDEDDELTRLRMDPDQHIPTIHLYFNDDLTVA